MEVMEAGEDEGDARGLESDMAPVLPGDTLGKQLGAATIEPVHTSAMTVCPGAGGYSL